MEVTTNYAQEFQANWNKITGLEVLCIFKKGEMLRDLFNDKDRWIEFDADCIDKATLCRHIGIGVKSAEQYVSINEYYCEKLQYEQMKIPSDAKGEINFSKLRQMKPVLNKLEPEEAKQRFIQLVSMSQQDYMEEMDTVVSKPKYKILDGEQGKELHIKIEDLPKIVITDIQNRTKYTNLDASKLKDICLTSQL